MQSFGSTFSWPSRDSLSSSHSFLFSESDQTEDEADVFLSEGEGDGGGNVELEGASTMTLKSRLAPDVFELQTGSPLRRGQVEQCSSTPCAILLSHPGSMESVGEGRTNGDSVFAEKCAELQGFIRPLLELLSGLKRGKYDRGLTSFQQSVAMDRIQRIVGVLQNPSMGEKYLHTLLQVEMMLKLWFPQISTCAPTTTTHLPVRTETIPCSTPQRWHRDQLHIPVKKRRLSWTDTDSLNQTASACKRFQQERQEVAVGDGPEQGASIRLQSGPVRSNEQGRHCENKEEKEAQGKISNWLQSRLTPVTCPPKSCPYQENGGGKKGILAPLSIPPVTTKRRAATQDTLISSTTPLSDPYSPTPLRRQPMRCQSEPIAAEVGDGRGWVSEMESLGRSLSLQNLTKTLSSEEQ
ncbi:hypothetical protein JZ751_000183 [Albula glossodonta]|uniref:Circadian associated repressor of transcription n=1 Tax=Albula glossodonta TaxID=121402 RepID=A0A8T2PVI8_9TELE|nr:hypothetical protein JZ751_000183 [Albula glossodonta]